MKAIETTYRGICYRSRTEARWAVFFTEARIAFDYEPEGFELAAGRYLPDFYLPEMDLWFEVKADATDKSELPRFEELCRRSGKCGIIAYGPPSRTRRNLQCFRGGAWADGPFGLLEDRRDPEVYWLMSDASWFTIGGPGVMTDHEKNPLMTPRLEKAHEAAAAERFGVEYAT